jgi:hypothetical protein
MLAWVNNKEQDREETRQGMTEIVVSDVMHSHPKTHFTVNNVVSHFGAKIAGLNFCLMPVLVFIAVS